MTPSPEAVAAPDTTGLGPPFDRLRFYEPRATAALAYCSRLCRPSEVGEALEASFSAAFAPSAADLRERDECLLSTLRHWCADHSAMRLSPGCAWVPALLAASAQGELEAADGQRLDSHLAACERCRSLGRSFAAAERVFAVLMPVEGRSYPRRASPGNGSAASLSPVAANPLASPSPTREGSGVDRAHLAARLPASAAQPARPGKELARVRLGASVRRRIAIGLLVLGVLLLGEAAVTLVWKEPVTAILASRAQAALGDQLRRLEHASGVATGAGAFRGRAGVDRRLAANARSLAARLHDGQALGRIQAKRIGIDFVVVEGTTAGDLRRGPGHYAFPQTVLPGQRGTVGIAGHRTTYLAPFRDIDALRRGDRIVLTMPYGRFTYAVEGHRVVSAGARDGFRDLGYARLVLSACHPLYSAAQRILVSARLVTSVPLGPAAHAGGGGGRST
ncbi:MAG: hypothetical protein NVS2B6_08790 [Thermoleophilaceae bacterium]